MGLCKDCQQRVTTLYCYEHKVNVCEDCILNSHSICIVQTYKQWLKDNNYDATCHLCHMTLESSPVLRLACLDIFHLECLKRQLSITNNDRIDMKCPDCKGPIIPPESNVSPIALNVRNVLNNVDWGIILLNICTMATPLNNSTDVQTAEHLFEQDFDVDSSSLVQEDFTNFSVDTNLPKYEVNGNSDSLNSILPNPETDHSHLPTDHKATYHRDTAIDVDTPKEKGSRNKRDTVGHDFDDKYKKPRYVDRNRGFIFETNRFVMSIYSILRSELKRPLILLILMFLCILIFITYQTSVTITEYDVAPHKRVKRI